jgi:hypothetical protein
MRTAERDNGTQTRSASIPPMPRTRLSVLLIAIILTATLHAQRWSEDQANAWYAKQPWLVGANYVPSNAINQLEMFQAATFDPTINDRELGWAEAIGMNTMRVFLQEKLWQQDPEGFKHRLDQFLTIADKHHIHPMLVLFDSCWDPNPQLGPQHPPIPGRHNSGWVQSPGAKALTDPTYEPNLQAYVVGIVGAFANDPRILAWDVWNEPDNGVQGDPPNKTALVLALLPKAFAWARAAHPTQPLTSGVWHGHWNESDPDAAHDSAQTRAKNQIQLSQSDIISFHSYDWPETFEARIRSLLPLNRPILCTEYMARGNGSTFDGSLPVALKYHVAAINWGLVAGKTQTFYPWDSGLHPYTDREPTVWFHDVFHTDGRPYRRAETDLIRLLTGRGTPPENP